MVNIISTSHLARASPPSILETYVNTEALMQMVKQAAGQNIADKVVIIIKKHLQRQPYLKHPYGPTFKSLKNVSNIGDILLPVYHAIGTDTGHNKFHDFLEAVNKGPIFRGMTRNPKYSGCLMVILEFKDTAGYPTMALIAKSNPYKGCRNRSGAKFQVSFVWTLPAP